MPLSVGDAAPDFDKLTFDGKRVHLADFRGEKSVVVYFYPKDETAGCTVQACAFRDAYQDFVDAGAVVIGISADSLRSHEQFASHHRLPFDLISDSDGALRKSFGVPASLFGLSAGRVTYVIDRKGVVRHVFNSLVNAPKHIKEALRIVKTL